MILIDLWSIDLKYSPIIIRGSYYRIFEKFIKIIALISIIDIENYVFYVSINA